MCGIAGVIGGKPLTGQDQERLARMTRSMVHRGPDGEGTLHRRHVALAMRRLSIIDLSTGTQPLFNEDRSVALVANGEIYNFIELRQELESLGHRFHTGSDCETAVHAYEQWGLDFVQHLRGMYAIALWDEPRGRLVLVRDRIGEKPLYIAERDQMIVFASELRSVMQSGVVRFDLDPDAILTYLHYSYVPEPHTPIRGLRKLPAGCMMTIDVDPWRVKEWRYWSLQDAPAIDADPVTAVREEAEHVTDIILRSDVPVGVALSGGFDSSAVAALSQKKYPGQMHAFSVGYSGRPASDERADARALAEYLKMPFHEVEVRDEEVASFFPTLVALRDDPIADISGHGYWAVSRAARDAKVPVLLQGHGGDEAFWGYPWVRDSVALNDKPDLGRLTWPQAIRRHMRVRSFSEMGGRKAWLRGLGGISAGLRDVRAERRRPRGQLTYLDLTPDFCAAAEHSGEILTSGFASQADPRAPYLPFTFQTPPERVDIAITLLTINTYLLENGIAQGDRLSMSNSVELRLPLVDYRFLETVIGLRKTRPDHMLEPKTIFRQAMKDLVPEFAAHRPKRGFTPPVQRWLTSIFEQHGPLLRDGILVQSGVLTPEAAARFSTGVRYAGEIMPLSFKALVLEAWARAVSAGTHRG